jgi:N-acetylmuramic acid 6-phosphate etherase
MLQPVPQTEQKISGLQGFDTWDNVQILEALLAGQRRALDAVERALPSISDAADQIAKRLARGGSLFYAGAGTSIRVAVQDGSELPATFGWDEKRIIYLIAGGRAAMFETLAEAEDNEEQGAKDGAACTPQDALIAVAASGRTPYTVAAAKAARAKGCLVIGVVNNPQSALAVASDIEVCLESGPEVISGSTRLGAGTAQKAALNLLSSLVHTKLGAVHDGFMVNVQAGNSKLVKRASAIVSALTGASSEQAIAALKMSAGEAKPAVLMLGGAGDVAAAKAILLETNGNLRAALAKLKTKA